MPSEGNVIDTFYIEGQLQAKFGEHRRVDQGLDGRLEQRRRRIGQRATYATGTNTTEFASARLLNPGCACSGT